MPKWFRLAVAIASLVTIAMSFYARPGLAPAVVVGAILLNLLSGVGTVIIGRYDRHASGDDDPASLNLHR